MEEEREAKSGSQVGDSVVGLNGQPMYFFDEFTDALKNQANTMIAMKIIRDGNPMDF